jgi:hypothetical protein
MSRLYRFVAGGIVIVALVVALVSNRRAANSAERIAFLESRIESLEKSSVPLQTKTPRPLEQDGFGPVRIIKVPLSSSPAPNRADPPQE